MSVLLTRRLELVPITLELVEAVLLDHRGDVARVAGARLPEAWPGPALVERAFSASLDAIRADPDGRLWGDRLMITRGDDRRVVGSVVFHGRPCARGLVEIGYGVEGASQGQGYGVEAVCASVDWAFTQPEVHAVTATTPPWHTASVRILERAGLRPVGWSYHETLGDLRLFERLRFVAPPEVGVMSQVHAPR